MGTRYGVKLGSFVHQPKLWCKENIYRCVAWRLFLFFFRALKRFYRSALQEIYHWIVEKAGGGKQSQHVSISLPEDSALA